MSFNVESPIYLRRVALRVGKKIKIRADLSLGVHRLWRF